MVIRIDQRNFLWIAGVGGFYSVIANLIQKYLFGLDCLICNYYLNYLDFLMLMKGMVNGYCYYDCLNNILWINFAYFGGSLNFGSSWNCKDYICHSIHYDF